MATDEIWPAVQALAATWSSSPLVEGFLSRHPAPPDSGAAVTEALRNLQAGTSALTEAPLVTMVWEQVAKQLPLVQLTDEVRSYCGRSHRSAKRLDPRSVGFAAGFRSTPISPCRNSRREVFVDHPSSRCGCRGPKSFCWPGCRPSPHHRTWHTYSSSMSKKYRAAPRLSRRRSSARPSGNDMPA